MLEDLHIRTPFENSTLECGTCAVEERRFACLERPQDWQVYRSHRLMKSTINNNGIRIVERILADDNCRDTGQVYSSHSPG